MADRRNYYRLLHVQPDAPREIIRSSYRTVMQKMRVHPDLGGDDEHAAIINEAYATLSDPRARAAYDEARLKPERARSSVEKIGGDTGRPQIHRALCAFCASEHQYREKIPANASCFDCQSPLIPARLFRIEEGCRRAVSRISKEQALQFYTHWPQLEPYSGQSDDISLNGMKFYSSKSLELEQVIKIDCQILRAVARVTHSQQYSNGWGIGVQFVSLCFEQSRGSFITVRA